MAFNQRDGINYLEKRGWVYCANRTAGARWKAPRTGTTHSFTEALRLQKRLDDGELLITKCPGCNKSHHARLRFTRCVSCKPKNGGFKKRDNPAP